MSRARIQIPGYVAGTWDVDPLDTEIGRVDSNVKAGLRSGLTAV